MEYKRDKAIKDITKKEELFDIISRSDVCHMGMVDGDKPYVLAFNFGLDAENELIYLHCAKFGRKLDILKKNNNVCLYFDLDHDLFSRHEHVACSWRMRYRSVQVNGTAELIEDYNGKLTALEVFMKNYSDMKFEYSKPSVENVMIIKIKINNMSGRKFEYL